MSLQGPGLVSFDGQSAPTTLLRAGTLARHGGVPFYKLVLQLQQEAEVCDVAIQSADLERETNWMYTVLEKRVQKAWDEYMEVAWTTSHFL